MPLTRYARIGAELRLTEIRNEEATILQHFPDLRALRAAGLPARRARRSMTAAQKRAVSVRMKAYWAARRRARH